MAVNNINVYNKNTDSMSLALSISRNNPNPVDDTSLYKTLADAEEYAKNGVTAYVGQIITVLNMDTTNEPCAYIIMDEAGTLSMVSPDVVIPEVELVVIAHYNDTTNPDGAWQSESTDSPDDGQILIIKTSTGDIQGYVWCEQDNTWYAFGGNVKSDNVLVTENITCAGDYTQVGNINKGTKENSIVFEAKDKTLTEVLRNIFTKELMPSIKANPSVSISFPQAKSYEVGTKVTPTYTATFNKGSYTYGPADTGVTVNKWEVTDSYDATSYTSSGSFNELTVGDDTNYKITVKAIHTDGVYAVTNLGTSSALKIASGTKSTTSAAITGYRACFYGSSKTTFELNSDNIRALSSNNSKTFNMNIVQDAFQVVIAYPGNVTLSEVNDQNAFGTNIVDSFVKSNVMVEGANGYTAKEYSVFIFTPSAKLDANVYNIKIV